jgi:hypothetical protein
MIWLTFGLFPYQQQTSLGNNFLLIRIIVLILMGSMGLIIIGAEFDKIQKNRFLKWYTIVSGLLILVLGFLSAFVYDDLTWLRTNISTTIYFLWFGVSGFAYLIKSH